jgi:DNA-binding CsgD family transcriptional regulator
VPGVKVRIRVRCQIFVLEDIPEQPESTTRHASHQQTREQPMGENLSLRELQVLRHIAAGLTYRGTARRLGISVHTVDNYIRRIRAKNGVHTQAELIRLALQLGL